MPDLIAPNPTVVCFTTNTCGGCGLNWAVDTEWWNARRADGQGFVCPNGCQRVFRETDADRERKKREQLERTLGWTRESLTAARELAQREARRGAAARGQVTRMRNRIKAGVCPVPGCKRTGLGEDVLAHIEAKHPTWHTEHPEASS